MIRWGECRPGTGQSVAFALKGAAPILGAHSEEAVRGIEPVGWATAVVVEAARA
jgi:hypothetical protein